VGAALVLAGLLALALPERASAGRLARAPLRPVEVGA
jgi:hypothetical protein